MNKVILFIIVIAFFVIPVNAAVVFQEDFESATKGNFTSCSASINFANHRLDWGTGNDYCYNSSFGVVGDFTYNSDISISGGKYFNQIKVSDSTYTYSILIVFANITGGFWSNEGEMSGAQIWIQYYNSTTVTNINDHTLNLNDYSVDNTFSLKYTRVNNNTLKIYSGDILIRTYTLMDPVFFSVIDLSIFGNSNLAATYIDNIVYSDSIYTPVIVTCSSLDISNIDWYDLPSLISAILSWLYSVPDCYYQSLINYLYTYLNNIFVIPIGLIDVLLNNILSLVHNFKGTIDSFERLMANVGNTILNSVSYIIDNAWFVMISLGFTIVTALRIYHFVKDISIAGFKI